jgi:hypothetical protein
VVPKIEKRALYEAIGNSWPSQNAQPLGAKFPAKRTTSPMKGFSELREGNVPTRAMI